MFLLGSCNAVELPKNVNSCYTEVQPSTLNNERLEKVEKILKNLNDTIEINKDSIIKAENAIVKHKISVEKIENKLNNLSKSINKKQEINKLKIQLDYHIKEIAKFEKVIVDLKNNISNCKKSIEDVISVKDYLLKI